MPLVAPATVGVPLTTPVLDEIDNPVGRLVRVEKVKERPAGLVMTGVSVKAEPALAAWSTISAMDGGVDDAPPEPP